MNLLILARRSWGTPKRKLRIYQSRGGLRHEGVMKGVIDRPIVLLGPIARRLITIDCQLYVTETSKGYPYQLEYFSFTVNASDSVWIV